MIPVVLGTIASSRRNQPASDSYTVYTSCALSSSITVYTSFGETLVPGITVYSNITLTTKWINQTLFVYYNGGIYYRYQTDSNGVVSFAPVANVCPYVFTIYGDCDQTGSGTIVYSSNVDPFPGGGIFTDDLLTIPYEGNFVYDYYNYYASAGSVTALSPCYRSWVTYADCNSYRDSSGILTTYYTAWLNSTLQNGVAVYTDSNLTVPVGFVTFAYAGIFYNTDTGIITSTAACVYSIPYNTGGCLGFDNNNTFYTTNGTLDNYSLIGSTIYSQSNLTVPITNANIYRNGYIAYLLTNELGVVVNVITCPT